MSYEGDLIEHYREVRRRFSTPVKVLVAKPIMHLPPPKPPRPAPMSWQDIVDEVAAKHRLEVRQLRKPGYRGKGVCIARHEAFYRLREERLFSWAEIGRLMGGFDHTTTLHGWRKHRERMGGE